MTSDEEALSPVSPFLGIQALGIATVIVGVSAGLGAWGVAQLLGVSSVCRLFLVSGLWAPHFLLFQIFVASSARFADLADGGIFKPYPDITIKHHAWPGPIRR